MVWTCKLQVRHEFPKVWAHKLCSCVKWWNRHGSIMPKQWVAKLNMTHQGSRNVKERQPTVTRERRVSRYTVLMIVLCSRKVKSEYQSLGEFSAAVILRVGSSAQTEILTDCVFLSQMQHIDLYLYPWDLNNTQTGVKTLRKQLLLCCRPHQLDFSSMSRPDGSSPNLYRVDCGCLR